MLPLLVIPVAVAFGVIAPATGHQRFLDVLVALALCGAAGGAMALIDGIEGNRPTRDIIVAVILVTFGLAAAFSMLDELAGQFVPAMWLAFVLALIVVIGVRLIKPGSAVRGQSVNESNRNWW